MPGFIDTTRYTVRSTETSVSVSVHSAASRASADIAFRVSLNERTGGWYTAFLSPPPRPRLCSAGHTTELCRRSPTCCTITWHISSDSAWACISPTMRGRYSEYRPKDAISRRMANTDTSTDSTARNGRSVSKRRPIPWRRLKFKLALDCRGARAIYAGAETDIPYSESRNLEAYALPDLISLDFGASCRVTEHRTAVWVQADNLLNRRNLLLPGCPTPGISLAAGVSIGF